MEIVCVSYVREQWGEVQPLNTSDPLPCVVSLLENWGRPFVEPLLCCDCLVRVTQLKPGRSGISMVKGVQLFHTLQHLTCLMAGDQPENKPDL